MITRTLDATFLNQVANDPAVRPWLGGSGDALDLTPLVANPANVSVVSERGGFIAEQHEPTIYEVHSLFLPDGDAINAMREGARYMFAATDCLELVTKVPATNKAAAGLARLAGFEQRFTRAKAWPIPDGFCDVAYLGLSLDRWMMRAPDTLEVGRWFHDRLEAVKTAQASERVIHEDDEAHDRAAGTAVLMVRAGNPFKAVATYNRWARLAGYQTIELVSLNPVLLDVRDAVIAVKGDDMEVVLCR